MERAASQSQNAFWVTLRCVRIRVEREDINASVEMVTMETTARKFKVREAIGGCTSTLYELGPFVLVF